MLKHPEDKVLRPDTLSDVGPQNLRLARSRIALTEESVSHDLRGLSPSSIVEWPEVWPVGGVYARFPWPTARIPLHYSPASQPA